MFDQNKVDEARAILEKIYPANEVEIELNALKLSIEHEKAEEASIGESLPAKLKGAFSNKVVRRGLYAGVTCQVAQQFVGINTVMYYSPSIVQFAGYASNQTALALSLVTSSLNWLCTLISMAFVDRYGRRKMMIVSMYGIIFCLLVLGVVFNQASVHSPKIDHAESTRFANSTCSSFAQANDAFRWNCMKCLKVECGFCSNKNNYAPGTCLARTDLLEDSCHAQGRTWYKDGCPSKFGFLAVVFLALYIFVYAPGMGTVPWIVNSEIYPLRYRGVGGGIAAVSNWSSNLIVSLTFLTLTKTIGASGTFFLFAGFSLIGLVAIFFLVPETKGLQFEEVEKMLEVGYKPSLCGGRKKSKDQGVVNYA